MTMKRGVKPALTKNVKAALKKEPGLTVKDLAERLGINRQFMAGVLAVLEEKGEVYHRNVGPARIYFPMNGSEERHDPGQAVLARRTEEARPA